MGFTQDTLDKIEGIGCRLPAEECRDCGEPTGKAGRTDDSLYSVATGLGPYCEICFDKLPENEQAWPPDDEDECDECKWPDEGVVRVWFKSKPDPYLLAYLGFAKGEPGGEWRAIISKAVHCFVADEEAAGNVADILFENPDAFDSGDATE